MIANWYSLKGIFLSHRFSDLVLGVCEALVGKGQIIFSCIDKKLIPKHKYNE